MICDLSCLEEDGVPACDCRGQVEAPKKASTPEPEPVLAG